MFGWRARIGYIVPSTGTVTENEWRLHAPEGVIFIGSRVLIEDVTVAGVEKMLQEIDRAALEVASAKVDVIVQVGTPAAFVLGKDDSAEIERRLMDLTGVPSVSMLSACLAAFGELGLKRLAVATPYIEDLNVRLSSALGQAGLQVEALHGLGIRENLEINALPPHASYRAARRAAEDAPDADGVFISSGGWPTFEILEALELDVGKPVVSSNAAALWRALQVAGVRAPIQGVGCLLARP